MTDEQYYSDREYITNTMLGWVMISPRFFKKKFDDTSEEETPAHMKFGKAMHMRILEYEKFGETYYVSKYQLPHNHIQKKFCDLLINASNISEDTMGYAYKLSYSTKNMREEKIKDEADALYKKYVKYISQERDNIGKIMLTSDEYSRIEAIINNLNIHKLAQKLTWMKSSPRRIVLNEHVLTGKIHGVKMKGKLDKIIIDLSRKVINIIDYKTASLKYEDTNFKEKLLASIDLFNYDRQANVYSKLVLQYMKDVYPNEDLKEYKIIYRIIAMKSNFDHEVRVFIMGESYKARGAKKVSDAINLYLFYKKHGYTFDKNCVENEWDELINLENEDNRKSY